MALSGLPLGGGGLGGDDNGLLLMPPLYSFGALADPMDQVAQWFPAESETEDEEEEEEEE
jgi:hypothetical protein